MARVAKIVSVDFSQSLPEAVSHSGCVDRTSLEEAEAFPHITTGKRRFLVRLVQFKKSVSVGEVFSYFREHCLKPAPLEVGLAFEKKNRSPRPYTTVLTGSLWRSWSDEWFAPTIVRQIDGRRRIVARCFESLYGIPLSKKVHFLAIVKQLSGPTLRSLPRRKCSPVFSD